MKPLNPIRSAMVAAALLLACFAAGQAFAAKPLAKAKPVETWPSYTGVLAPLVDGADWLPREFKDDPQLRQELNVFMTTINSMGYYSNLYQDTAYPDFWPVFGTAYNYGFNDPNDSYLFTAIDDKGSYKISGYRGTVRILEFEIGSAEMQVKGSGSWGQTLSNFSLEGGGTAISPAGKPIDSGSAADGYKPVSTDSNGYFEVVLSAARPAGYTGDWWQLKKGAVYIMVRRRAYDWEHEVDSRLAIDRLDVPAMRPRRSAEEIKSRIDNLSVSLFNWTKFLANWPRKLEKDGLVNKVRVFDNWSNSSLSKDMGVTGGVNAQRYIQGVFDIQPDEALVLETEVPSSCRYWMFHLTDMLMSSIDQMNRQTSINGYQARLDTDGKFRAVISIGDPGVPNWLDTGGHGRGVISGRWWSCNAAPQPVITKVKLADVRSHVAPDTPVVTPEQRDTQIRARRKAAQLRHRW